MLAVSMATGGTAFHYDEGDDDALHARLPLSNIQAISTPRFSTFKLAEC
jgi:hypothetical protein